MTVERKSHTTLSTSEWSALIAAITAIHGTGTGSPRYRDFVRIHERAMNPLDMAGMSWGVHTMSRMMRGRNFFAWHRLFLLRFEQRLQRVNPAVALPYWDWISDPNMPAPLNTSSLLRNWGVSRRWQPSLMPTGAELAGITSIPSFGPFQAGLEGTVHADVHNAVGGTMATSSSPADPLFWLHHANIDRLWADWQSKHPGKDPLNPGERLRPGPIFNLKVANVLNIASLGYKYA